jgi:hypothetical protein
MLPPAVMCVSEATDAVTVLSNTSTTIVAPTPTLPLADSEPARLIISESSLAFNEHVPARKGLAFTVLGNRVGSVPLAVMFACGSTSARTTLRRISVLITPLTATEPESAAETAMAITSSEAVALMITPRRLAVRLGTERLRPRRRRGWPRYC